MAERTVTPSLLALRETGEGHRVTTLELFFDLVYVFAFTQVTGLMAHGRAPWSLLEGFIVFGLLWWTWCSYSWLGNHVQAHRGLVRFAMMAAIAAMFVACLAIPEAFHDLPGGLSGPAALVVCYVIVRLLHLLVYLVAAGPNRSLRRQVLVSLLTSLVPAAALLAVGVAVGGPWQRPIWLAAVLYDLAVIFLTSRGGGGWEVRSAVHFAERYSLVVNLALGESIVAIAVGIAQEPLSWPIVAAAVLAIAIAIGVWRSYFHRVGVLLEHGLAGQTGKERARMGRDVFTYLHLPIVAGIILGALGIEQATAHLDDGYIGVTGAWALGAGLAICLLGSFAATLRASGVRLVWRPVAAAVLVALAAVGGHAHPLVALAVAALVVAALGLVERRPEAGDAA